MLSKISSIVCALIALPLLLQAQGPAPVDTLVAALFEKKADIIWIKHYGGRVDDIHPAELVLGSDGNNCRGFLIYNQAGFRIQLDGKLNDGKLFLKEVDAAGSKETSGYINGSVQVDKIEADWVNANNTLGAQMQFSELKAGQNAPKDCDQSKWIKRYTAEYKNKQAELVLLHLQGDIALGQFWSGEESYELKGKLETDGDFSLKSTPLPGQSILWLDGSLRDQRSFRCNWTTSNGEMRVLNLSLKESLTTGCYSSVDYISSIDMLYPQTTCATCNAWMRQQIETWSKRSKSAIKAKKLTEIPANRNVLRASIWPEISCWSDEVFSGYLSYIDSWSPLSQGQSFNFDLRSGQPFTFEDLFAPGFDAKAWRAEYTRKEMPKMPGFADDTAFREWLYKDGFPLFSVRRDGIKFSTYFHPIYGQQHLIVPYEMIKPYLKENSPVAVFVK